MIEERDISVAMRDGTRLAVDVYRPDKPGEYPVLYASALHNKDIQGPDIADILPPQPAHAPLVRSRSGPIGVSQSAQKAGSASSGSAATKIENKTVLSG
jgi:predicted acyl esterase